MRVQRLTVDLTGYPDLVVIYLGLRVNRMRGLRRVRELGPQIGRSAAEWPDGLLNHEMLLYSAFPLAHRHAPVLARPRFSRSLDPLRPPSKLVAGLPPRHRRDRFLARDLPDARRHGSHLRRYAAPTWPGILRARDAGGRRAIQRPRPRW